MMTYSMFAGNMLTLRRALLAKKKPLDWLFLVLGTPPMIFAFLLCGPALIVLAIIRRVFLPRVDNRTNGTSNRVNAVTQLAVDLTLTPGETGTIGWFMCFTHGFLGALIAGTRTYKSKWFKDQDGEYLSDVHEASMTCGAVALSMLFAVQLRTALGKAPWAQLKYFYRHLTFLGLGLATAHVILMGYKGWDKIFLQESHYGQPSITWVSSMFPTCVFFVWLLCKVWKVYGSRARGVSTTLHHTRDLVSIQHFKDMSKGDFAWITHAQIQGPALFAKLDVKFYTLGVAPNLARETWVGNQAHTLGAKHLIQSS